MPIDYDQTMIPIITRCKRTLTTRMFHMTTREKYLLVRSEFVR
jgi:hypothetical protein